MKKINILVLALLSALILVSCGSNGSGSKSSDTQLISQTNNNYYQGVIKKGHYVTSKSRGVSVQQNDNQLNLKGFENGLLSISKSQFPTDSYILQEGQYIDTSTAEKWLDRKSKDNPEGLNPAGKDTKEPMYLQQMDEQDFMEQSHGSLNIKGMTIGLGINSVYYYRKEAYGAVYQRKLDDKDVETQGKAIANQVLKRLRQRKDLKNIPIVIALYKQASNDSLVGGNFFASSVNDKGATSISNWKSLNIKNYVLPDQSNRDINSNDEDAFENFKNQVQKFFPNLSGVTAQAHYVNGNLRGMHINITTQFYGQSEVISFTQYVDAMAKKYLPNSIPIDIQVSSSEGIQSFLSRKTGNKDFYTHVFTSY
ncbi:CamS family sex pheromone protein [Apilactobacillus bombintestini]|uniref:CamS family sex pheromone protein n=1 Tax=Apilactobacillus bombintestini TaxID=2419772 RepID=A0A387AR33_9LACO|nr:CamS family sex pheromone protein [Apilactobacillus bombintestini]AYF92377.1 CamS family sex pheromone protein [Apilactobacillus bombintestini]